MYGKIEVLEVLLVTDLTRRAEYWEFAALRDSLIRDQIVVGINDRKRRERLLRETDLPLHIKTLLGKGLL